VWGKIAPPQELQEENRALRRQVGRQERELARFSGPEGDLPVLLRAHNEETRVLKAKMKAAQESNRQLGGNLQEKHLQVLGLREANRSLKQINMESGLEEKVTLKTELEELKEALERRDTEVKDLLHRQDILEKSHKQQLVAEMKKKKEVRRQLAASADRIKTLEGLVLDKDKQINRLHIYSRRQGERGAPTQSATMRSSVSKGTGGRWGDVASGEHGQPELGAAAGHQPPLPGLRTGPARRRGLTALLRWTTWTASWPGWTTGSASSAGRGREATMERGREGITGRGREGITGRGR
jgi:hypothetical protein